MMKKQMQKAVCLLLGSVLLLSMGACGKKDKTSARDVTDGSSVTATQTTQVVREIKSHKGEIGEEMQYQDVDAVMKKAYVSDYTFSENGSEIGLTFFEFEITNNSEDELAVDLLSQTFGLTVDGEAYPGVSIRSPLYGGGDPPGIRRGAGGQPVYPQQIPDQQPYLHPAPLYRYREF